MWRAGVGSVLDDAHTCCSRPAGEKVQRLHGAPHHPCDLPYFPRRGSSTRKQEESEREGTLSSVEDGRKTVLTGLPGASCSLSCGRGDDSESSSCRPAASPTLSPDLAAVRCVTW